MLRAAALCKLGRAREAQKEFDEVCALRPDFLDRRDFYVGRYIRDEQPLTQILEGLDAASLSADRVPDSQHAD